MLSMQKRSIVLQKGFTLIELMIVVAIVAILAIIAVPMYQNYIARTQMTEALTLADSLKIQVADIYAQDGVLTGADSGTTAAPTGIPASASVTGTYVASVAVADGVITATMKGTGVSAGISGKTLVISPDPATPVADRPITWACTSNALPQHVPKPCVGTVAP